LLPAAWRWEGVPRMCPGLRPGPGLSTQAQGHLSRGRVSHTPFALHACPSRWAHHLEDTVYAVQSGVHGAPALRLTLSPDATRGRSRCAVGHARGPQFGAVRGDLLYLPYGPLS